MKLKDESENELDELLLKLKKSKTPYVIEIDQEGKIVSLDTKDKELIDFAKKNNNNLN